MTDLKNFTIASARKALKAREISATELANTSLAAIKASDLNAFITVTDEAALSQAKAVDEGKADGLLAGIPVAVKDIFCTNGVRTTAASKMLENFVPPYESTTTARIFGHGGVMVGKANCDEFAMGSANLSSHFGPVKNPLDKTKVPGGSSGGSAAAVADSLCLCALGTDTGGSIRQPASFCGITGLKTTYGLCSRFGVIGMASSLDTIGPMAKTVEDTALLLQAIAGYDENDATSANRPVPDYTKAIGQPVKGMKIGIPKEYRPDNIPSELVKIWDNAAAVLEDAGCQIVDISLPNTKYALAVYYAITTAEISANLSRYDGVRFGQRADGSTLDQLYINTRSENFGQEVQRRLCMGTYILSADGYKRYFEKAQKVRRLIANDFYDAFKNVDALLVPTAPSAAFGHNDKQDAVSMYLADIFTVPASLAGCPSLSVPAGKDADGMPMGMQVIGNMFAEETLFKLASVIEGAKL